MNNFDMLFVTNPFELVKSHFDYEEIFDTNVREGPYLNADKVMNALEQATERVCYGFNPYEPEEMKLWCEENDDNDKVIRIAECFRDEYILGYINLGDKESVYLIDTNKSVDNFGYVIIKENALEVVNRTLSKKPRKKATEKLVET